jgi:cytochrome oxidase assembly protein ShyY1
MKRAAVLWALPAALACAAFASLGAWQLQRGAWKERLLAGWSAALAESPRDYADVVAGRDALPRREDLATPGESAALPLPVRISGRWDPATTVLLDNQRVDGTLGVMVFTRFLPTAGATPLLVNRGWQPLPPDRTPPRVPAPADDVVVLRGLLVAPPAGGLKLGSLDWQPGAPPPLMASFDLAALRAASGALFGGVLQLDPAAPDGFTRRWQPLPNTLPPEKHRGYAVQWFGLATAVAVIYLLLAFRRP